SAHAAYNGSLVLLAVLVAVGPTHVLTANGVSVTAHSDWHVADVTAPATVMPMVLKGPSGATFVVEQFPAQVRFPALDDLASAFNDGQVPLPENTTLHPGTAHVVVYPMG